MSAKKKELEFTAKVMGLGRITIPRWVREELGIADGSIVKIIICKVK